MKTVKQMLKDYNRTKTEIANLKVWIEEIEWENDGVGAINYDTEGGGNTNKFNSVVENTVVKGNDELDRYKKTLKSREREIKLIENTLNFFYKSNKENYKKYYFIITKNFFEEIPLTQIALKLDISDKRVSKLKAQALEEMEALMFR